MRRSAASSALEGTDALSAYIGGRTAVDSSLLGRAELGRAFAFGGAPKVLRLSPYAFAAVGKGWIAKPTAIETATFDAVNLGAGVRGTIASTGLGFTVEYAHGFSGDERFDTIDRVVFATTLRF